MNVHMSDTKNGFTHAIVWNKKKNIFSFFFGDFSVLFKYLMCLFRFCIDNNNGDRQVFERQRKANSWLNTSVLFNGLDHRKWVYFSISRTAMVVKMKCFTHGKKVTVVKCLRFGGKSLYFTPVAFFFCKI